MFSWIVLLIDTVFNDSNLFSNKYDIPVQFKVNKKKIVLSSLGYPFVFNLRLGIRWNQQKRSLVKVSFG